jgi:hypothetical protein
MNFHGKLSVSSYLRPNNCHCALASKSHRGNPFGVWDLKVGREGYKQAAPSALLGVLLEKNFQMICFE